VTGYRLLLRAQPQLPLEASPLSPAGLSKLRLAAVERLPLGSGRRTIALAELFRVEGGPGPSLVIAGDCRRLDGIGRGLAEGSILVEGDAGHELGAGQSGGVIRVLGSAANAAARGMQGGILRIGGSAGDFLGGAAAAERFGMRGGLVVVAGDIGRRAGDRMRRGVILVGGSAGPACGARMIAGTIAVGGRLGPLPALRMRRGTVIAAELGDGWPATFADSGRHDLTILKLMARRLSADAPWLAAIGRGVPLRRLSGDLAVDGKGEIVLLQD